MNETPALERCDGCGGRPVTVWNLADVDWWMCGRCDRKHDSRLRQLGYQRYELVGV